VSVKPEDAIPVFGYPEVGIRYEDRPAAYAVILGADTVATVRSLRGAQFLPGGGALPGEYPEQTVQREIREELGSGAILLRRIGEATQYFFAASDDRHYRMQAVFFIAELAATDAVGEEVLHWLPIEEAPALLFHLCHAWAVAQAGA